MYALVALSSMDRKVEKIDRDIIWIKSYHHPFHSPDTLSPGEGKEYWNS